MEEDRNIWNRKWREKSAEPLIPDAWLMKVLGQLPAGRALDLACGRGRNALFLAAQGWQVTGVDISEAGLEQLRQTALEQGVKLDLHLIDLERSPQLPTGQFDLVLDFFYLQRSLFAPLKEAVRPGGMAVVRTFTTAGDFPGGPGNPRFVLRPGELLEVFADWEILIHEEGREPARKGGGLAGILARKPMRP